MKNLKSKMGIVVVVLTLGIAALAFGQEGNGSGYGGNMMGYGGGNGYAMGPGMMGYGGGNGYAMGPGMMGYGSGYGHMNGYYGSNGYGNLSPQNAAKLEQSRQKFFNETQELRNSIRDKQFALNDELQKPDPDGAKVLDLQKQLSQVQGQFDQKALAYQLELRKELPKTTYGNGYGRGYCRW